MVTAGVLSANYDTNEEDRRCRSCTSTAMRIDWPAGDRICTECGVVDDEHLLDERPEWREYEDEAPTAPQRCGLVPNNEEKWIGGLQPTTLSKYIFGGGTQYSSRMRKTLVKCNHIIERRIEKHHAQSRKNAQLENLIRKRKRRHGGWDIEDDEYHLEPRPKFERLILEEEDNALANTAALNAQKWSLSRCLLLFGRPEEHSVDKSDKCETIEELRQNLDSVLTAASRELYRAYTILVRAGRALKLPEIVLNDASNRLSGYAARKDSLFVRGVSSQLKRYPSNKVSAKTHKQAQIALRDYNLVKQYSALAAALLFYTARQRGHFRPLADICRAMPSDAVNASTHLERAKGEPVLKLKHCSKAMAEVKQVLPDLARNPTVPESIQRSEASEEGMVASIDSTYLHNYVNHATRSLQLPPVAEKCLHILMQQMPESEKLPLRTASLTYFLGSAGKTMQTLAAQSKNRKRPHRVGTTSSTMASRKGSPNAAAAQAWTDDAGKRAVSGGGILPDVAAEEKAYEMQRVWNAWNDQTPWWRSLAEISNATQVPTQKIRDHYKQIIHPQRHDLLQGVALSSTDNAPLSSILLPHIALAAPLMKEI